MLDLPRQRSHKSVVVNKIVVVAGRQIEKEPKKERKKEKKRKEKTTCRRFQILGRFGGVADHSNKQINRGTLLLRTTHVCSFRVFTFAAYLQTKTENRRQEETKILNRGYGPLGSPVKKPLCRHSPIPV